MPADQLQVPHPGRPVRVVLADDQPLILSALAGILDSQSGIDVVAQVSDGPAAVAAVSRCRADVVVLDVYMDGGGGLTAASELRRAGGDVRILLLTSYGAEDVVRQAMDIGIDGFLVKDCSAADLVAAVRRVNAGGAVLSPEITRFVMDGYKAQPVGRSIPGALELSELADPLTLREQDVLTCVAKAMTNAEIARELTVGETTVKTYISRLIAKLHVRDRVGLAVWAHESGFLHHGATDE